MRTGNIFIPSAANSVAIIISIVIAPWVYPIRSYPIRSYPNHSRVRDLTKSQTPIRESYISQISEEGKCFGSLTRLKSGNVLLKTQLDIIFLKNYLIPVWDIPLYRN